MTKDVLDYDIAAVVSRCPWFKGLPAEAQKQLSDSARIRSYRKNSYLYTTGEFHGAIFCILSGRIRLLLTSTIGQEYAVTDIVPEAWVGEQFLVGDTPTTLDAQVVKNSTVLIIPCSSVLLVAEEYPEMYRMLFEHTMERSRGVFTLLRGMAFYPLRSRLAGWLLNLIEEHGQETDEGIYLDINLSQNDLAQLTLGSRQRINKILSKWRDLGVIELDGNRYLIRDIDVLTAEMELKDNDS
jgi:CRP/FNR family cyclic AMP-dependent transcriptional regulator